MRNKRRKEEEEEEDEAMEEEEDKEVYPTLAAHGRWQGGSDGG